MKYWTYNFPEIGEYGIAEENGAVCRMFPACRGEEMAGEREETPILQKTAA